MALAALIAAYNNADGSESLRATLPIGGHALVEHQARQAAQAGARHVVLLVERVPASLTAAVDRLRRTGLGVEVARSVADAADHVHPEERLLVIADGLIADQVLVDRVVAAGSPALLAVPDDLDHQRFERIDANARWGGLMLVDGDRLRRTATMLGDWDLQSTLLRRAVQEGAARVTARSAGEAAGLLLVDRPEAVDAVRERLMFATRGRRGGWPARWLYAPLEDLVAPALMRAGVDAYMVRAGAVALLLLAAAGFAGDLRWFGLGMALLAGPVDAIAARLARMGLHGFPARGVANRFKQAAEVALLLCFAWHLARSEGWGAWTLAGAMLGFALALAGELRMLRARLGPAVARPAWIADAAALTIVLLPFAVGGHWLLGAVSMSLYAAASFFWVQQVNLRAASAV